MTNVETARRLPAGRMILVASESGAEAAALQTLRGGGYVRGGEELTGDRQIKPKHGRSNQFVLGDVNWNRQTFVGDASAAKNIKLRNKAKLEMRESSYFTDVKW